MRLGRAGDLRQIMRVAGERKAQALGEGRVRPSAASAHLDMALEVAMLGGAERDRPRVSAKRTAARMRKYIQNSKSKNGASLGRRR